MLGEITTRSVGGMTVRSVRKRVRLVSRHVLGGGNLAGIVAGAVVVLMALACFAAPAVFGIAGPNAGTFTASNLAPGAAGHLLGTDALGNDLLSRCLFGGRVSFEVAAGAVAVGCLVGEMLGLVGGFIGRTVDAAVMRLMDMLLGIPAIVLALAISAFLGPNEQDAILAISLFTIPGIARVTRGITQEVCSQRFVAAARLDGGGRASVLIRHVLPNVVPRTITYLVVLFANAMVIEAALSFLGADVPPPQPSWGNMIAAGIPQLAQYPWEVFVPAGFLVVTVLAMNVWADWIRRFFERQGR